MNRSLYGMKLEEIMEDLKLEKKFQARIVRDNLVKGVTDFSEMTSLSKKDRERLSYDAMTTKVIERQESESTVKLAIRLSDGLVIECVRLSDGRDRFTACLSSQVGCAMGCAFCKTGTMGLRRNLEPGEIIEQFVHLEKLGEEISHIVFMGMGEPLNNFTAVMEAIQVLHDPEQFNISYRKITISTSGFVPGIHKLTELELPLKLAVSLVTADDNKRSRIMRINRTYPLSELKKALISFQHHENKRITLEYCMLKGYNTGKEDAEKLRKFMSGMDALVNLIPWNPVEGMEFETPTDVEIRAFTNELKKLNINYSIRREKGRDISGACGQLASKIE